MRELARCLHNRGCYGDLNEVHPHFRHLEFCNIILLNVASAMVRVWGMRMESRYAVLDGLRGIAAIGVVLFHLSIVGLSLAPHGYLAVDFFFVLSGFVMSHAYANSMASIGFCRFFVLRLIRILPLSILGLCLGSTYFLFRYFSQNYSLYNFNDIVFGSAFNLFLLPKPWVTQAPTDTIFPTNTPLWSLSLEVIINLIWAAFLINARSIALAVIVVFAGFLFCFFTLYFGTADIGATWPTYFGGLSRAIFGFFAGVLLWRYRPQPIRSELYMLISVLTIVAVLFAPDIGPFFDIVAVLVAFPFAIYIATSSALQPKVFLFGLLGDLSYPLYVVHVPVLMFSVGFAKLMALESNIYLVAFMAFFTSIATAFALDRIYDRPVRKFLAKCFRPQ